MNTPAQQFLAEARRAREVLVVTGAGVSVASGIPTFRGSGPDAVWARHLTELATCAYFERDPVGSWKFSLGLFDKVHGARPNPAHDALAQWQRWQEARGAKFRLVTQNVDSLHEAAGSRDVIKVHGSADRLRCSRFGCEHGAPRGSLAAAELPLAPFVERAALERIPRCPACGALVRPHVLWFDERYDEHQSYAIEHVLRHADSAELVVFVGTSFSVGVTDLVLDRALHRGARLFSIDPSGLAPHRRVTAIPEPAELLLPRIVAEMSEGAKE
jgi:NAD-dependent deacetylase